MKEEIQELKRQIEEYETIFATMPVMLWYKDTQNRMIRVNDAAARLEGVDRSHLEGKRSEEVYPPEQAAAFGRDDQEVIQSRQAKMNFIEKHTTPSGEDMWLQTSKVPYVDKQGQIIGVIAIAVDITEQQRAKAEVERQNRQLERVQEFIFATLDHLQDSAEHGADRAELLAYVQTARDAFARLQS